MLRNREEKITSLKEMLRDREEKLGERESHLKRAERQLRVQERKMRHLHSLLRDRGFEVEDSEELEAASAGQPSTSEASLPLSLLARRSRGRGPVRSDEPPQTAGRDEPPQAAGRDNLKLAAAKDHSSGAA
ncbi:uncharacterized protein LOC122261306 isoform X3 [Penaeus japonicus]|uniref:uncharacterized protein LOC122261306 isoform X3 n=1 Tax=Penaeus japonicus TaxID=27405 RepID=UPI001C711B42|nr:uncharacterized protein LOC122261306 isoform X3 [Penaeus japonicus]